MLVKVYVIYYAASDSVMPVYYDSQTSPASWTIPGAQGAVNNNNPQTSYHLSYFSTKEEAERIIFTQEIYNDLGPCGFEIKEWYIPASFV